MHAAPYHAWRVWRIRQRDICQLVASNRHRRAANASEACAQQGAGHPNACVHNTSGCWWAGKRHEGWGWWRTMGGGDKAGPGRARPLQTTRPRPPGRIRHSFVVWGGQSVPMGGR